MHGISVLVSTDKVSMERSAYKRTLERVAESHTAPQFDIHLTNLLSTNNNMFNYITSLHNHLQKSGEGHTLTWVETPSGLSHQTTWTIECKISGQVKGTGVGLSKADAKQTAAKQALAIIRPEA